MNKKNLDHIFPIQKSELGKFIPMCSLLFLMLLARNLLRNVKDCLVATEIGTESISFTTIFVHVPLAFIALKMYNNLLYNSKNLETTFRRSVIFLTAFYLLFAAVLFPYRFYLQPSHDLVEKYLQLYPHLKWFVLVLSNWIVAIFAVLSELWAIIICSIAYWQLANQITSTSEASRFYIFFSSFGQLNLIFSGFIVAYFSNPLNFFTKFFSTNIQKTELFVKSLIFPCVFICLLCLIVHKYLEKNVVNNPRHNVNFGDKSYARGRKKVSLIDNIKFVFSSKYFRCLCIMTFSYSAIMNWSDGIIMCMIKKFYANPSDMCILKSKMLSYTGIITLIFSILGTYLLRIMGWFWVTVSIPLIILITGVMFFTTSYLNVNYEIGSCYLVVFIAGLYTVLTKGIKYSLFDSTKEMTYVPLDPELKQRGEGAVDVVGDNIGKVLGCSFQLFTFIFFPALNHEDLVGPLGILCVATCLLWIYAVANLSKEYKKIYLKGS